DISSFCIIELTEVGSIVGPSTPIAAGDSATYTIILAEPALVDGAEVKLTASDPAALTVPESVFLAQGQQTLKFQAKALGPGRVRVTGTLGSTSKSRTPAIGGLVMSEVSMGTPGKADHRQWVELSNLTSAAIDLSKYSLGAGDNDYTTTRVQLDLMLPP